MSIVYHMHMHVQKNTNQMPARKKDKRLSAASSSSSSSSPPPSASSTSSSSSSSSAPLVPTVSPQVTTTNTAMTTTTSETSVTEKTKGQLNRVTCRQRKEESKGPLTGHFPEDIVNFNHENNYADWCLFHSGTACALITLPTCYNNAPRTAKGNEKMLEFGQAPQDEQEWCQRRES
jgi:hypothetical protein